MTKQIGYQDISLMPKKCIVGSRSHCDTSIVFGGEEFHMPVYPSNMKSVVDIETCKYMASQGWFYTMHRFDTDIFDFVTRMMEERLFISISVGINTDSYEVLQRIYHEPLSVDYITIDVANAWSEKTHQMISFIKDKFPETFLIVGNVATGEAAREIEKWGADAIKVGIAGGSVCITKNKTGIHRPMVSTIKDCVAATASDTIIIADGGVVEHGDIAKAIACGATMVMAGSLFAGYDQSAGRTIEIEDWKNGHVEYTRYKEYYGSASNHNKNEYKNVEGKKTLISYRGDMGRLLIELEEDLQSSISYTGGQSLRDLNFAEYFEI